VPRPYRLAVLGGTFDHFHVGHEALVSTAFRVGDEVAIGLTTDRFVRSHPKPDLRKLQPFSTRKRALVRWIQRTFPTRKYRIVPLENTFGRSVEPDVDVLVVSPDTVAGGRAVNRERRRLGRPPIPLEIVPLVLADDLSPVSSRRIRAGTISPRGRRRSTIRVELRTDDPNDVGPARRALRRAFPRAVLVGPSREGRGPGNPAELFVAVRRGSARERSVTVRASRVRLGPRRLMGRRPHELERGLLELLRPREKRKLFGALRSSSR